MRVLHVARRFVAEAWGGTESVVAALVRAQRAVGHDARLLATAALSVPGREEVLGVPVERFGYSYARFPLASGARAALDRKGGNPLSLGLLRRLLASPGADVLHCHTMQRIAGEVRFAARRRGVPYVVHLHGGGFAVPRAEVAEMLAPTRGTFDWGKAPSALLGTRRALADADLVLALSAEELARTRAALPGTRVELLPNGVDPGWLAAGDRGRGRAHFGLPAGAPVAVTVARVDPQKGQELIPLALAAVPELHAVLAGPVTVEGYDEAIRSAAAACGVADRLHLLGPLVPESRELADLYAAADIFLLPSRHEPFGIVVLEAWAAGLAPVASRVGGLADLVRPGVDGVLVPSGDGEALGRAVAELVASPERLRALGAAGRRRVVEDYSWSAIARRLAALYDELRKESR